MVFMNVFFVHLARLLVLVIGGLQMSTWDQQFSCKHIDGSLILEMRLKRIDSNFFLKITDLLHVRILGCALSLVLKT